MFSAKVGSNNEVQLVGRFDASQVAAAKEVLDKISTSSVIDFRELEYISSAGMGVLLATQKRLSESGHKLALVNLNKHIKDIFGYAGFDRVFEIR
ncbi:MAG TPA: STAS domain-containing protein [Bacteroidota bacterium]|jgi:anti-anti-sigma factor